MSSRARRGVALFAALALLGVIALLVGAAFSAFHLASRSSEYAATDAELTAAAEYAVSSVVDNARALGLDTIRLGAATTFAPSVPGAAGIAVVVDATRLPGSVAWLVADASITGAVDGHRRVNIVARWPMLGAAPPSVLTSRGDVRIAAGVTVANDTSGDADCRGSSVSAVTVAPGATVTSAQPVAVSTSTAAADSSTYFLAPWQLAALAPSANVVRVAGDTTISGGAFRGILIVGGSLTIAGPFTAEGLVISRGPIVARAGGLVVTGAIQSFATPSTQSSIDVGPATLTYSPCVVAAALRRAIPLRPVRERSWGELF